MSMKFIKYYNWVAQNEELKLNDKLVYCSLLSYQGDKKVSWASQITIANALGISRKSVCKSIKRLSTLGWISVKVFGHGKTNRYSCIKNPINIESNEQPVPIGDYVPNRPIPVPIGDSDLPPIGTPVSPIGTQPVPNRDFLVIEKEKTNQPTILIDKKTTKGGSVGFSLKSLIEGKCNYEFNKRDESIMEHIEKGVLNGVLIRKDIEEELNGVIDDWIGQEDTKHSIQSIPGVLNYRLQKRYDNS